MSTSPNKTLIIAEKPSVANDIAKALATQNGKFEKFEDHFESEHFLVTSAVGHLVEIQVPPDYEVKRGKWSFAHLPVIPPGFVVQPIAKTKSRLGAIVKLIKRKDVAHLINACDAGREGELIFRLIQQYAKARQPVQRLWLQSMTPQAIRDGFTQLRDDTQMQGLADAARSRSEADWLVGINGTRAMTAFNSQNGGFFLTTVGRVQTPTLAIVVEREEAIRRFVKRDYWEVHAEFGVKDAASDTEDAAQTYPGKWFDPKWKKNPQDAEQRADRLWDKGTADALTQAVQGLAADVHEESKPSTQSCPLLFDLTALQREANSRFGFSAKNTLAIAQSLYERHKVLTYPRTDSRALPADYVDVARKTVEILAQDGHAAGLSPFAQQAVEQGYVRPNPRIFNDKKVSDHFAIIPTMEVPKNLSEAEQKIYDTVTKRFLAIFFPAAEFLLTTRISKVRASVPTLGDEQHFKTEGKVLVQAGWLAIYGKEASDQSGDTNLLALPKDSPIFTHNARTQSLHTRPPARLNEATLLGAMEGAGKLVEDEELRLAMQEKGLGTPATRAATIEGLLSDKYLLREGRELLPTTKAFQLLTLLRGLQIEDLCKPELTGNWENQLARMERGQLSRAEFMQGIAEMTKTMVEKAKAHDRDNIPGDYATLTVPCPKCKGTIKENYRRYACIGQADGSAAACGFSFTKTPASRTFAAAEAEQLVKDKHLGPLTGFRSKAGWPFSAELKLQWVEEDDNWKLAFDFEDTENGKDQNIDFSGQTSLGACPICTAPVFESSSQYLCSKTQGQEQAPATCTFKSGKIILQQVVERAQMEKLLSSGSTDLLDKFVSARTRRPFKAFLRWDEKAKKVSFAFEERSPSKKGTTASKSTAKTAPKTAKKTKATTSRSKKA